MLGRGTATDHHPTFILNPPKTRIHSTTPLPPPDASSSSSTSSLSPPLAHKDTSTTSSKTGPVVAASSDNDHDDECATTDTVPDLLKGGANSKNNGAFKGNPISGGFPPPLSSPSSSPQSSPSRKRYSPSSSTQDLEANDDENATTPTPDVTLVENSNEPIDNISSGSSSSGDSSSNGSNPSSENNSNFASSSRCNNEDLSPSVASPSRSSAKSSNGNLMSSLSRKLTPPRGAMRQVYQLCNTKKYSFYSCINKYISFSTQASKDPQTTKEFSAYSSSSNAMISTFSINGLFPPIIHFAHAHTCMLTPPLLRFRRGNRQPLPRALGVSFRDEYRRN